MLMSIMLVICKLQCLYYFYALVMQHYIGHVQGTQASKQQTRKQMLSCFLPNISTHCHYHLFLRQISLYTSSHRSSSTTERAAGRVEEEQSQSKSKHHCWKSRCQKHMLPPNHAKLSPLQQRDIPSSSCHAITQTNTKKAMLQEFL